MAKNGKAKEKGKSSGMMGFLIVLVLLTVVAGGVGFLGGHKLRRSVAVPASSEPPPPMAEAKIEKPSTTQVLSLPAVVTNLAGEGGSWVRLEAAVIIGDDKPVGAAFAGELAETVTALLRTLTLHQIAGASGFMHLREEILDRLKMRSKGRVSEITIHGLVIE